ncbi:hypothetical protein ACEXQD_02055 [Herbiconiux sp. P15]|uniref:hypothetical protein n=1 Tax=Herbiconiux liukaitaii TaxID=3342799 RepID=UPI0035B74A51
MFSTASWKGDVSLAAGFVVAGIVALVLGITQPDKPGFWLWLPFCGFVVGYSVRRARRRYKESRRRREPADDGHPDP